MLKICNVVKPSLRRKFRWENNYKKVTMVRQSAIQKDIRRSWQKFECNRGKKGPEKRMSSEIYVTNERGKEKWANLFPGYQKKR